MFKLLKTKHLALGLEDEVWNIGGLQAFQYSKYSLPDCTPTVCSRTRPGQAGIIPSSTIVFRQIILLFSKKQNRIFKHTLKQ